MLRTALDSQIEKNDRVPVGSPLEYLLHHPSLGLESVLFGASLRTPGKDELTAGSLYGEGIVNHPQRINARG